MSLHDLLGNLYLYLFTMKIMTFWDMTQYSLVDGCQIFRGTCWLPLLYLEAESTLPERLTLVNRTAKLRFPAQCHRHEGFGSHTVNERTNSPWSCEVLNGTHSISLRCSAVCTTNRQIEWRISATQLVLGQDEQQPGHMFQLYHLKTKRRPLYLKTQSVPRCKHFSSRL